MVHDLYIQHPLMSQYLHSYSINRLPAAIPTSSLVPLESISNTIEQSFKNFSQIMPLFTKNHVMTLVLKLQSPYKDLQSPVCLDLPSCSASFLCLVPAHAAVATQVFLLILTPAGQTLAQGTCTSSSLNLPETPSPLSSCCSNVSLE